MEGEGWGKLPPLTPPPLPFGVRGVAYPSSSPPQRGRGVASPALPCPKGGVGRGKGVLPHIRGRGGQATWRGEATWGKGPKSLDSNYWWGVGKLPPLHNGILGWGGFLFLEGLLINLTKNTLFLLYELLILIISVFFFFITKIYYFKFIYLNSNKNLIYSRARWLEHLLKILEILILTNYTMLFS